jgi:nucleotide-binding universal stress UspA family protein
MKTLLLHLGGTARDEDVLAGGALVARQFGSHLSCLRIEPDPFAMMAYVTAYDIATAAAIGDALNAAKIENREKTRRAEEHFLRFCKSADIRVADKPGGTGISASWSRAEGDQAEILIRRAKYHDAVVLAGGSKEQGLTVDYLGSVVLGAGRPLVLTPEGPVAGHAGTIAIAWKDTPEAARAVAASMPLLEKAQNVLVLGAVENDAHAAAMAESLAGVVTQLRWHGVEAEARPLPRKDVDVADALLGAARAAGAGLFVMGGYGHSRLREVIFGGVTEHVLNGVDLPVFIAH